MKMRGLYSVRPLSLDGVSTALRMEDCAFRCSTELSTGGGGGPLHTSGVTRTLKNPIKTPCGAANHLPATLPNTYYFLYALICKRFKSIT